MDFTEVTAETEPGDKFRFGFYRGGGCSSPIGMYSNNRISIGNGCESDGTIQHEIMHSLGI